MLELGSLPLHPFSTAEARSLGLTRDRLDDMVVDGWLRRVLRGVYQRYDAADSIESRTAAAAIVVTRSAVFCDRTAAWLHGVDVFDHRDLEVLPRVDCVVPRGRARIERDECEGGERDLAPCDVMQLSGVWVTTPLRTALDLGCKLRRPDGLAALDMFARLHRVTRDDLWSALPRYRGRRGVVKLRGLLPLVDPRAESAPESRTRLRIHDAGLPAPEPQHWVLHRGVSLFRLDLAYPRSRVAVEYDGEWHDRTPQQHAADTERRAWLRQHGWTVIVVRRGELSFTGSAGWLDELRTTLTRRP